MLSREYVSTTCKLVRSISLVLELAVLPFPGVQVVGVIVDALVNCVPQIDGW